MFIDLVKFNTIMHLFEKIYGLKTISGLMCCCFCVVVFVKFKGWLSNNACS